MKLSNKIVIFSIFTFPTNEEIAKMFHMNLCKKILQNT